MRKHKDATERSQAPLRQHRVARRSFGLAAIALAVAGVGIGADARVILNSTPASIRQARDLGPVAADTELKLTLWLRSQNEAALTDQQVQQLYDQSSPNFHRWVTDAAFKSRLAPTGADLAAVQQFALKNHLTISSVGEHNLYVRVQGSAKDVQNALRVQLHQFQAKSGQTFRANTNDPSIEEPAGASVAAVSGLSEHRARPMFVRAVDVETGEPSAARPLVSSPNGLFFSPQCLRAPERHSFNTNGGLPTATYSGNRYGQDITNSDLGTLAPCGYQPSEMQTAYGLTDLYKNGLDGSGQTIVIVDAYGSPTIAQDAELFSQVYGLPDLTAANFQIYYPGGQPAAPDTGWASETTLDVEWAHSVAPKANIALVIAPTSNDDDLEVAVLFAIKNHLGHVISNSYGEAEADNPPSNMLVWNRLSRMAAAHGISVHFSSGDDGDSNPSGFTPNLTLFGVSVPANSPWATGIGGTSVFLDANNNIQQQTSWGNNLTRIVSRISQGSTPIVPPLQLGFQGGSGGGTSAFFPKPRYQSRLDGSGRMVPDISMVADPFTGVEIICDAVSCGADVVPGPIVAVFGGTSLSCPMFSALWAIANQAAGEPLGHAASTLYRLGGNAITDVRAPESEGNVHGRIKTATGTVHLSADDLAQPLFTTHDYLSAIYNSPFSTRWFVITFGTNSSLTTTEGWDNSTGLGSPNGASFINAVVRANEHE
jgi:subtilase family serine protease